MDEAEFRRQLNDQGYGEPAEVEWEAGLVNEDHTHDFSASLFVLSGEMTAETPDGKTTCRTGEKFSLAAGIVHAETVGPEGVRFLVGRK